MLIFFLFLLTTFLSIVVYHSPEIGFLTFNILTRLSIRDQFSYMTLLLVCFSCQDLRSVKHNVSKTITTVLSLCETNIRKRTF